MKKFTWLSQFLFVFYCFIAVNHLQAIVLPPDDLKGHQISNEFVSQTDIVNIIQWHAPNSGEVPSYYYVYRDAELTELASIVQTDNKLHFHDHQRKKNHTYSYYVVSVDSAGLQSAAVGIIFEGKHTHLVKSTSQLLGIEITPFDLMKLPLSFDYDLEANGIYPNGITKNLTKKVQWISSNPSVASISSSGVLHPLQVGTIQITAFYKNFSSIINITITDAMLVAIQIQSNHTNLPVDYEEQFQALGLFSDQSTLDLTKIVKWSSTNTSIASISNKNKGLAFGLNPGTTTIVAKSHGITGNIQLAVTDTVLTSIEITPIDTSIGVGYPLQFIASGFFSDLTVRNITDKVKWSSSNQSVASISNKHKNKGKAIGRSIGSTQIKARLKKISAFTSLIVNSAYLTEINITPDDAVIPLGSKRQFRAHALFSDGSIQDFTQYVLWTSLNPITAIISNVSPTKGIVLHLNPVATVINAMYNRISDSTPIMGSASFRSGPSVTAIDIFPNPASSSVGSSLQFNAIATFSDGTTTNITNNATWTSTIGTIATISPTGLATGISKGQTFIAVFPDIQTSIYNIAPLFICTLGFKQNFLPDGLLNQAYSQAIIVGGNDPDTTPIFTLSGGNLPPGLILNPNGVISGIPTKVGVYNFNVQVSGQGPGNCGTLQATQLFTIGIDNP